ncbi:hypothetical protein ACJIZ3_009598 [Penstemon smallii]|uniref:Uncharacterized protein n=1 Tax=Penstemon smallii TaxID=265156 RepID=A0ABD3TEX1_9LAMI
MRFKVLTSSVECFASSVPPSCSKKHEKTNPTVAFNLHSNPFVSKNPLKSQTFNKIQRSCSVSCGISKKSSFKARDQDSFLNSRIDFLEPVMLGIRPEFPHRPDQETVMWTTIEHKAKRFDIPLSLRMIKKKLQCEEGCIDDKNTSYCSVKSAFASMVFIIVELHSHALEMREALCREDIDIAIAKVHKEMHSSFVWLFQQVFSKTPDLMLDVMILLANFSVHSISQIQHFPQIKKAEIGDFPQSSQTLGSREEINLWNSMVDEATKIREGIENDVLDYETMLHFVSPVSVEVEPDGYEDYLRTDLLYQMNLSHEPNNPLLLCNYAQFLHLVAHDYDRAEECFKRAVQVLPPDAESLNQYAIFLWKVRKDFWGAEERFIQALAAEPENSYYASRYANFLWTTGGEETCFPLNNSHNPN